MSYYDTRIKEMKLLGKNATETITRDSKQRINNSFTDDPSYRLAEMHNHDLTVETDVDIRLVNIDKSTSEKKIYFRPDKLVKVGNYIKIIKDGTTYIIDEYEDNLLSPCGVGIKCDKTLNWKGLITNPIPCVITNSSYGSKGETHTNQWTSDFDSRGVITCQRNTYTENIYEGMRFYFGSEWDIYEVTKKQGVFKDGTWQMICKYTKKLQEDDLANGICYNPKLQQNNLPSATNYVITGSETIRYNVIETYTLEPLNNNIIWNLDEDSVNRNLATIVYQDNINCQIKALVSNNSLIQIEARNSIDGSLLAYFNMYAVK